MENSSRGPTSDSTRQSARVPAAANGEPSISTAPLINQIRPADRSSQYPSGRFEDQAVAQPNEKIRTGNDSSVGDHGREAPFRQPLNNKYDEIHYHRDRKRVDDRFSQMDEDDREAYHTSDRYERGYYDDYEGNDYEGSDYEGSDSRNHRYYDSDFSGYYNDPYWYDHFVRSEYDDYSPRDYETRELYYDGNYVDGDGYYYSDFDQSGHHWTDVRDDRREDWYSPREDGPLYEPDYDRGRHNGPHDPLDWRGAYTPRAVYTEDQYQFDNTERSADEKVPGELSPTLETASPPRDLCGTDEAVTVASATAVSPKAKDGIIDNNVASVGIDTNKEESVDDILDLFDAAYDLMDEIPLHSNPMRNFQEPVHPLNPSAVRSAPFPESSRTHGYNRSVSTEAVDALMAEEEKDTSRERVHPIVSRSHDSISLGSSILSSRARHSLNLRNDDEDI